MAAGSGSVPPWLSAPHCWYGTLQCLPCQPPLSKPSGATHITTLGRDDQPAVRLGLGHREHDRFPGAAGLPRQPDDPTVFATAFIYFSGHQRIIAAATIGGWRAVKNMSF
jgi:hypothetical protein